MLNSSDVVKDLRILIHESLSSKKDLEHKDEKVNIVLYILERKICTKTSKNWSQQVRNFFSSCLRPSMLCAPKTDLTVIEKFQKRMPKMDSWNPIHFRISIETVKSASSYASATE